MDKQLNFKISSALKDIIGKDLINDDFVAVFELVKNSFDAGARFVNIVCEDIYDTNATIKIIDDGKGMNYEDIVNKWLFVAYSAKTDGTEDQDNHKIYAGAKGIGRFACDSLGANLLLQSMSKNDKLPHSLYVDWNSFEKDSTRIFQEINILYDSNIEKKFKSKTGTYIEISNLRRFWDREKLLKLKESLAKLILPNDFNEASRNFNIELVVDDERERDSKETEYHKIVNGPIENFIFQKLEIKTTRIFSKIADDNKSVTTKLFDGGQLIYSIVEENEFTKLDNIEIDLYYLNRSAKYTFTNKMGITPRSYGNVFMYKNGFRIYPYGEPGEDPLKIDSRKAQGYNRFLGTRDLIGQIKISTASNEIKESSSRSDGLLKTDSYTQLTNYFMDVLRKLEKYVVDTQLWGLNIDSNYSDSFGDRINDLIFKLTDSSKILKFDLPDNIYDLLGAAVTNSAEGLIGNLRSIAKKNNDHKLLDNATALENKLEKLILAKNEAELDAKLESKKAEIATQTLKDKIQENFFLKSINSSDYQEVLALLHHIGIYAGTIDNNLRNISLRMQNDITVTKDKLEEIIKQISFETKKILSIVGFATKANFKLTSEDISRDLGDYIYDYIETISPSVSSKNIHITTLNRPNSKFVRTFKPIEVNIVIDNIISNAAKAKATDLFVDFEYIKDHLTVTFIDNGNGIADYHLASLFDFGFTTTDGSGLGLYHVKKILEQNNNKIEINNNMEKGAKVKITFK